MIPLLLIKLAEEAPAVAPAFDLNTLVTGGAGAALVSALIFVVKLILDRTIPTRTDARDNVKLVLESLNSMVKVLQDEKLADAKRLADKRTRIEYLETEADKDYDRISELRAEVIDLKNRLASKDKNILILVTELRRVGAEVTGLDLLDESEELEITLPKALPPISTDNK